MVVFDNLVEPVEVENTVVKLQHFTETKCTSVAVILFIYLFSYLVLVLWQKNTEIFSI